MPTTRSVWMSTSPTNLPIQNKNKSLSLPFPSLSLSWYKKSTSKVLFGNVVQIALHEILNFVFRLNFFYHFKLVRCANIKNNFFKIKKNYFNTFLDKKHFEKQLLSYFQTPFKPRKCSARICIVWFSLLTFWAWLEFLGLKKVLGCCKYWWHTYKWWNKSNIHNFSHKGINGLHL